MKTENIITEEILHHTEQLKKLNEWANEIDGKYIRTEYYGYVSPILENLYAHVFDAMDEISKLVGFEYKKQMCLE